MIVEQGVRVGTAEDLRVVVVAAAGFVVGVVQIFRLHNEEVLVVFEILDTMIVVDAAVAVDHSRFHFHRC